MAEFYLLQVKSRPESPVWQGRSFRPLDFPAFGQGVVRYWIPLRSITGGCPESPEGRNVRPLVTGASGLLSVIDKISARMRRLYPPRSFRSV